MRQKCGRLLQSRTSTNALEDSQDDVIRDQVKLHNDEQLFRRNKEDHTCPTGTFERIEPKLKAEKGDNEFLTKKEYHEWNTERFEKIESRFVDLTLKIDQLYNKL